MDAEPPESDSRNTVDQLLPLLYRELKSIARRERRRVSAGQTLATTALIHELYLKLPTSAHFNDHEHFLRAAAKAMRHVLVDYARANLTAKRGAGAVHVDLDDAPPIAVDDCSHILFLHEALERLAQLNARLVDVVECRYFAGYSEAETAKALGVGERTVQRDWMIARSWLKKELAG